MSVRAIILLLCCATLPAVAGCRSAGTGLETSYHSMEIALSRHNPVSIENYRRARTYAAEGRYELAKEHYLLAYAAAEGDAPLRTALARELKGVEMMIKTLR